MKLELAVFLVGCTARPATHAFVTVSGGRFVLDGKPYRFAGNNTYYLALSQTDDPRVVDRILAANRARGVRVIRFWAFWDGDSRGFQPRLGEYNEKAFQRLDLVLRQARAAGIRLIPVFTNNWQDFGGMDTYVRWVGARDHCDFYRDPRIRETFKRYIHQIVTRTNTLTGVAYKDDPTILAWELANEPRCEADPTGETVYRWVAEMSAYVKSLDPKHLVAIGDEGFFKRPSTDWAYNGSQGVDWERNLTLPTVDYGVFHLWLKNWNKSLPWGDRWIEDHVRAARQAGKPIVLEEYGHYGPPADRDEAFAHWYRLLEDLDVDGTLAWMMTEKDYDDNHPGFTHRGTTAELLAQHARRMHSR